MEIEPRMRQADTTTGEKQRASIGPMEVQIEGEEADASDVEVTT